MNALAALSIGALAREMITAEDINLLLIEVPSGVLSCRAQRGTFPYGHVPYSSHFRTSLSYTGSSS